MKYRAMAPGEPAFFTGDFENDEAPTITVLEDDAPEFTGLLDADGRPIYRVRERIKMGFHV